MILLKRVAMIVSYVMLDIQSISFQKYKKVPRWYAIPIQSHMSYKFEKPFLLMQLVFSLSFVKLLWPFERIISYAHDQDRVHIHSHAILLHWKIASTPIRPSTNNTPCHTMTISLQSYHQKVWAIQKEIKDAYPKKVCHMPARHVKKIEKRCIPKEGMPHAHKACQKKEEEEKENIAHTKNITREREFI